MRFILVFAGALTFTHNATSLILPGGANITTAAGDVAWVESLGAGNWKCLVYQKADGTPVINSTIISSGTYTSTVTTGSGASSASASADFTYTRVGSIVTVSGRFTITPNSASSTVIVYASLPVASGFTANSDASGCVSSNNMTNHGNGYVIADETNDRFMLVIQWGTNTVAAFMTFVAQYQIK
jgi:hypothetical protein